MQIEIVPQSDGSWAWQRRQDDGVVEEVSGFPDRSAAIAAGREAAGAEEVKITRKNGDEESVFTPPAMRVVLLRLDGSEVGELDPALGSGGPVQTVTLSPATSSDEAASLGEEEGA